MQVSAQSGGGIVVAWIMRSAGPAPWLAGVFSTREAAERQLAELPAAIRAQCSVHERPDLAYPCLAIEDDDLRVLSAEEAAVAVAAAARDRRDDEWVYVNLYRLTGDFESEGGRDEMGALPHRHLRNGEVDVIAAEGVAGLWGP